MTHNRISLFEHLNDISAKNGYTDVGLAFIQKLDIEAVVVGIVGGYCVREGGGVVGIVTPGVGKDVVGRFGRRFRFELIKIWICRRPYQRRCRLRYRFLHRKGLFCECTGLIDLVNHVIV